jgi:hypothetical protein
VPAWEITFEDSMRLPRGQLRRLIPGQKRMVVSELNAKVKARARDAIARIRQHNRRAFGVGGHQLHGGRKWRRLKERTIELKGHGAILIKTGAMRRKQHVRGDARVFADGTVRWKVVLGNRAEYAHYHGKGFTHHWSKKFVRPRVPTVLTHKDKMMLRDEIRKGLR